MTVLLTILKVIGWILLGILGLILLTVLTVLLVPIRYRADGVWKEEKYIRGRVTWLLHLLSIRVTYEKELLLEVRVAGFLIYPKKERSGKKKKAASGAPIIKESGISRRHGRRSGLDFTSWEKLSDMYCRESWRFLESSGQAIRLLPDRSWRYRECCVPGIKEISGWNRILKRNISKENFTSKAESGLEPLESADLGFYSIKMSDD